MATVTTDTRRFVTLRQIDRRLHQLSLHPQWLRSDVWRDDVDRLLDTRNQATEGMH